MSTIQFSSVNHLETVRCTLQRLSSKKHTWQVLWLSLGLRHPVPLPVPWFGAKTCPLSSLPPPLPPPRLALPARLLSLEPHSTSPGMKGPTKRRVQRFEQINTTGFLWFWYFISPLLTCFGWWHPKLNSRCYRRRFNLQTNILRAGQNSDSVSTLVHTRFKTVITSKYRVIFLTGPGGQLSPLKSESLENQG